MNNQERDWDNVKILHGERQQFKLYGGFYIQNYKKLATPVAI